MKPLMMLLLIVTCMTAPLKAGSVHLCEKETIQQSHHCCSKPPKPECKVSAAICMCDHFAYHAISTALHVNAQALEHSQPFISILKLNDKNTLSPRYSPPKRIFS